MIPTAQLTTCVSEISAPTAHWANAFIMTIMIHGPIDNWKISSNSKTKRKKNNGNLYNRTNKCFNVDSSLHVYNGRPHMELFKTQKINARI